MAKYTIKDLAEGKCTVKNDGTVKELNKVLKAAFPDVSQAVGNAIYYFKNAYSSKAWTEGMESPGPVQSVKEFLEELEKPKLPKRGDRILVQDYDEKSWIERIFITYIEGANNPVVCVAGYCEKEFNSGEPFDVNTWSEWKPIPEKEVLEVTLEDVAKQFKVDEVRIVEKKGENYEI